MSHSLYLTLVGVFMAGAEDATPADGEVVALLPEVATPPNSK
jgi:hypothetical protein